MSFFINRKLLGTKKEMPSSGEKEEPDATTARNLDTMPDLAQLRYI